MQTDCTAKNTVLDDVYPAVTLSTTLLQVAMAVKAVLQNGCAVIATVVALGLLFSPLIVLFLTTRGIVSTELLPILTCLYRPVLDVAIWTLEWLLKYWGSRGNAGV